MRRLTWLGPLTLAVSLVLLGSSAGAFAADDKPEPKLEKVDVKALDFWIRKSLYYAINTAVAEHNSGDVKAGYQIFREALQSVQPLLNHHPDIQTYIKDTLAAADKLPSLEDRSFKLREALDNVRESLKTGDPIRVEKDKTLWDRLGGEEGVKKIVAEFVATAKSDKAVNFDRGGKYKIDADTLDKIKSELVKQISYLTEGPYKPEKDATPPYKDLGITEAEFAAGLVHLGKAMAAAKVLKNEGEALYKAVEGLRKDIVTTKVEAKTTMWDRVGGEQVVTKIIDDFVTAASKDPMVNFNRSGKVKLDDATLDKIKKELKLQFSYRTDGPYKAEKGATPPWKGLGINDAEFDAAAMHLKAALEKNKVDPLDIKLIDIGGLRELVVEPAKPDPPKETVYDRLGGEKGVKKIVDDFVATASKDKDVNIDRGGKFKLDDAAVDKIKKALVAQISFMAGNPEKYNGDMKAIHKGMEITDAEFTAHSKHLKAALEKNGVKEADVKTLMDLVEKTRKDVVEVKKPDKPDDPPKEATVTGKVTLEGKPIGPGKITFYTGVTDKNPVSGEIKEDGTYKVTGLKTGTYRITVEAGDKVMRLYRQVAFSPLSVEITKEEVEHAVDLKP